MDDLLALMEEDDNNHSSIDNIVSSQDDDDDDATKLPSPDRHSSATNITTATHNNKRKTGDPRRAQGSTTKNNNHQASVDLKVGIRMTKRIVGSMDLLDLVVSYNYISPASLVSQSSASLNTLLQDPAMVVNTASVAGRTTNLLTIGIVLKNSGTKITSNGRAFSILEIGNLQTGPVLSIFLFGDAYSQRCQSCKAGMVVAVLMPNIVAPKPDSNKISLSVRDGKQLQLLATALDYGICSGTTKSKRNDGKLMEYRCKVAIDVREGTCCKKHRLQSTRNKSTDKDQKFRQRFRETSQTVPLKSTPFCQSTTATPFLSSSSSSAANPRMKNVPRQMVKGQAASSASSTSFPSNNNPYSKRQSSLVVTPGSTMVKSKDKKHRVVGNITLPRNNPTTATKKRISKVNQAGSSGMNGSVFVPKAHAMFSKAAPIRNRKVTPDAGFSALVQERTILDRQKSLKQAFLDKSNSQTSALLLQPPNKKRNKSTTNSATSFMPNVSADLSSLNRSSRFATEASAEEYAKSRTIVESLEQQEARATKKVKAQQSNTATTKVQREFHCQTCKRTFHNMNPKHCRRLGHKVILKRTIEETKTATEQRLKLSDKDVEDGGLKLGSGVEWTKYY